MTTLMALLPVAISALIGAIVGFHYARKEHERRGSAHREQEDTQQHLPFMTASR
jgi:hypothetical protein